MARQISEHGKAENSRRIFSLNATISRVKHAQAKVGVAVFYYYILYTQSCAIRLYTYINATCALLMMHQRLFLLHIFIFIYIFLLCALCSVLCSIGDCQHHLSARPIRAINKSTIYVVIRGRALSVTRNFSMPQNAILLYFSLITFMTSVALLASNCCE